MRLDGWDVRLARWATRANGLPFEWGRTDCAMLCFQALEQLTGRDVCSAYAGQWHSRSSALRYQARHGTNVTRELVKLGCVDVPFGQQQRGDFVIVEDAPFPRAHVCFGEKVLSSAPRQRVAWLPMNFHVAAEGGLLRLLRSP